MWALANDDIHDLTNLRRLAVAWNMIDAPSAGVSDVVAALRGGRTYAVSLVGEKPDAALVGVDVHGSTLTVSSAGVPATFVFIGQDGAVRKTADQVMHATYPIEASDTYVRTVIRTPNMVMYVNPIIRYDGESLPVLTATVNAPVTWVQRFVILVACVVVTSLLWRRQAAQRAGR
jgi:hypothetical protein